MIASCFEPMSRITHLVVPAKAGTHNHRVVLLKKAAATASRNNEDRWLWVPAFAGTTPILLRYQWVTLPHSRDMNPPSFALRFAALRNIFLSPD
ncbi:MAG: hypothetical protein ACI4XG_23950 [Bradyrhizobium sp.]